MRTCITLIAMAILVLPGVGQTTGDPTMADLKINGQGGGGTSPVSSTVPSGNGTLEVNIKGGQGCPVIGAVAAASVIGSIPVPQTGQFVDLDIATLAFAFDGTGLLVPSNLFTPFYALNTNGEFNLSFQTLIPNGPLFSAQAVAITPVSVVGFFLTQSHDVTGAVPGPFSLCPATVGGDLSPLSDDGFVVVPLGGPAGAGFTFYGVTRISVFVNMNGNLTFNAPNSDFTPTGGEMLSREPTIAPVWDNWLPNDPSQGTVRTFQAPGRFECEWFDVRHRGLVCAGGVDSNSFCVRLDMLTGNIEFLIGTMRLCENPTGVAPSIDQVVGISPGDNQSQPNNVDLTAIGGNLGPGPLGAIYEDFGIPGVPPFDLGSKSGSPQTLTTFVPLGGVGIGPYFQF